MLPISMKIDLQSVICYKFGHQMALPTIKRGQNAMSKDSLRSGVQGRAGERAHCCRFKTEKG